MGHLRIGSEKFTATDSALQELQHTLQKAFAHAPGMFLHMLREGSDTQVSIWVSPASEIVMKFDSAPKGIERPVIVGFDPWTDEDRDAL